MEGISAKPESLIVKIVRFQNIVLLPLILLCGEEVAGRKLELNDEIL
jgi:hypothetical protein